jgi:hypothetical protein
MFVNGTRGFILLLSILLFHCADATKYQAEFRGSWALEARKNAQGQEIVSPAISGVLEWFPTAKDQAHVLVTISTGKETVQVFEAIYSFQEGAFTAKGNLHIGGVLGSPIDATYEASGQQVSGQIKSEDARVVLTHSDGTVFEFIGTQLTVTYKNGTADRWKLLSDQKGTLAD